MTERPILFQGAMVRAIREGRKTQTRRLWKMPRGCSWYAALGGEAEGFVQDDESPFTGTVDEFRCPYGEPGDRLWVREAFAPLTVGYAYAADPIWNAAPDGRWRPSIHMPRSASRITLEITEVRVERLQSISFEDALAEGVADYRSFIASECTEGETADECARRLRWPQRKYQQLWDQINGAGAWDANPWCWAVSLRLLAPNT